MGGKLGKAVKGQLFRGWQIVYRPDGYEVKDPMRPPTRSGVARRFGHLSGAQRFIAKQVKGGR
jgi:hypothetical protein